MLGGPTDYWLIHRLDNHFIYDACQWEYRRLCSARSAGASGGGRRSARTVRHGFSKAAREYRQRQYREQEQRRSAEIERLASAQATRLRQQQLHSASIRERRAAEAERERLQRLRSAERAGHRRYSITEQRIVNKLQAEYNSGASAFPPDVHLAKALQLENAFKDKWQGRDHFREFLDKSAAERDQIIIRDRQLHQEWIENRGQPLGQKLSFSSAYWTHV